MTTATGGTAGSTGAPARGGKILKERRASQFIWPWILVPLLASCYCQGTGELLKSTPLGDHLIELAWINDQELLTVLESGEISIWNIQSNVRRHTTVSGNRIESAKSASGVITVVASGQAYVFDTEDLRLLHSTKSETSEIASAMAVDESRLLIAGYRTGISLVSIATGKVLSSVDSDDHSSPTWMQVSADGNSAIVYGPYSLLIVSIRPSEIRLVRKVTGDFNRTSVFLCDDGHILVPRVVDRIYDLLSCRTGELVSSFNAADVYDLKSNEVIVSGDQATVAAAYLGGNDLFSRSVLFVWNRDSQRVLARREFRTPIAVARIPKQSGFAIASGTSVSLLRNGVETRVLTFDAGPALLEASPDGTKIAAYLIYGTKKWVEIRALKLGRDSGSDGWPGQSEK